MKMILCNFHPNGRLPLTVSVTYKMLVECEHITLRLLYEF